jgi:hypothetical protein
MFLSAIPTDLQDLIFEFAWKKRTSEVRHALDVVLELKVHNLPANFYHAMVWSWIEQKFVPLPLVIFSPVEDFRNFFNFSRIRCILMQLDFRKRHVKSMGNRIFWLKLFQNHWSFAVQFGHFLKLLQTFPISPYCPTYEEELTRSGSRFWGGAFPLELL